MFKSIRLTTVGNADYDPIEIEAEIYTEDEGEALTSVFIQQVGYPPDKKEIVSVEPWQLDDLIEKLTLVRDTIKEFQA